MTTVPTTTAQIGHLPSSPWLHIVVPDNRVPVLVKLFHDQEDRASQAYGPYVFVQTVSSVLRGIVCQDPREEEVIAEYHHTRGLWRAHDGQTYTDVVCWPAAQGTPNERNGMQLSPEWTDPERLSLIARLLSKIVALPPGMLSPGDRLALHRLAETATLVATESSTFLEANRAQILADTTRSV
jgi:hypothetical protein